MNYDQPELLDRLAAEYALGTLRGPARRRFERLCVQSSAARLRLHRWEDDWVHLSRALAPVRGECFQGVAGGARHVRIGVRREATQFRLEAGGADVPGDEQDDGQVLAPPNGFGHEGLGPLAAFHQKHARDGALDFVRRAERLDERAAGRPRPDQGPE